MVYEFSLRAEGVADRYRELFSCTIAFSIIFQSSSFFVFAVLGVDDEEDIVHSVFEKRIDAKR